MKQENTYKVVPLEFNFTVNSQVLPKLNSLLPPGLNPFVEAGLTYYIWQSSGKTTDNRFGWTDVDVWEDGWDFFEIGLNLGLGAEYYFKPNLAVSASLKRYIVFDKDFNFWNWQVGVTFTPKNE